MTCNFHAWLSHLLSYCGTSFPRLLSSTGSSDHFRQMPGGHCFLRFLKTTAWFVESRSDSRHWHSETSRKQSSGWSSFFSGHVPSDPVMSTACRHFELYLGRWALPSRFGVILPMLATVALPAVIASARLCKEWTQFHECPCTLLVWDGASGEIGFQRLPSCIV